MTQLSKREKLEILRKDTHSSAKALRDFVKSNWATALKRT